MKRARTTMINMSSELGNPEMNKYFSVAFRLEIMSHYSFDDRMGEFVKGDDIMPLRWIGHDR